MQLERLLQGLDLRTAPGVERSALGLDIERVTVDSRNAGPAVLFVAAPGATPSSRDGHAYLGSAVAAGCPAVVVAEGRESEAPEGATTLISADPRRSAALLCERLWGDPSKKLRVIGVTGTNGKTTVSFVLARLLVALGRDAAVLGTLGIGRPDAPVATGFTTPEAEVLAEHLDALAKEGVTDVVMEVSSHALVTRRADGVSFAAAAFTNLSQDHLDFHGSMEAYWQAKLRLFDTLLPADATAVVPQLLPDVATADPWRERPPSRVLRWGPGGDVYADEIEVFATGVRFVLVAGEQRFRIESPLVGRHNLENLVVAASVARALGHSLADIVAALPKVGGAPGRFERVGDVAPAVVVDFAHSPGALERALTACRQVTQGRVLVVFGAGGDRDARKRRPMGEIAGSLADGVWLTNDNPRSERPSYILEQLEAGVVASGMSAWDGQTGYTFQEDREQAIFAAIANARDDDVVLLAGKGHEAVMLIGEQRLPFDDREVAARALALRADSAAPPSSGGAR